MGRASRAKRQRREVRQRAAGELHVAVLTAMPDQSQSLRSEIVLCKAALLYADRATLYSPKAFMLASILQMAGLDGKVP